MALLLRLTLTAAVLLVAAGILAGCTGNDARPSESSRGDNVAITNASQLANTTNPFENSTMETPNATALPGP